MKRLLTLAGAVAILGAWGCGTSVTRIDTNEVRDLSGRWNDTDSRLVAENMIQDCLSRPWLTNYQSASGKPPVVIVGTVHNQSMEHIATDTFIEDLQRELINSGKVQFVANKGSRGEVREERLDQDVNASEETRKAHGQEIGADFMLSGTLNAIQDREGGKEIMYYQTNLKLLDMKTNLIVWNGEKKIKKYISRSRASW